METPPTKRFSSFPVLTVLALAAPLAAQEDTKRYYLPTDAICTQLGDVRARVLGTDGRLYLMLHPRLCRRTDVDGLRKEMEDRDVPRSIVDALTSTEGEESSVTHLGGCARSMVKAFLEQFLNNVETIDDLTAITERIPEAERRKILLVTVDAGLQVDGNGQCEAVLSLRLVRLRIGPAPAGGAQPSVDEGGELLFADRATAPMGPDAETPRDACRAALTGNIREIAANLFGWERMVTVDWRKDHAATLGSGLNEPISGAKEQK